MNGEATPDLETEAAIEALRRRGAPSADPVRFRRIEALARRAVSHQGLVRIAIDERLKPLLVECSNALDAGLAGLDATTAPSVAGSRSPLAVLLDGFGAPAAVQATTTSQRSATPMPPPVELKAVREHRRTWSRLKLDQQMSRVQKKVPDQAGPLNTQRLLHHALSLMRDASPEYTQHFMAHVEALLWLDRASLTLPVVRRTTTRKSRQGG